MRNNAFIRHSLTSRPFKFPPRRHRCSHPWTASCHHRIAPQAEPRSQQLCPGAKGERHTLRMRETMRNVSSCLTMSYHDFCPFYFSTSPYFSILSILATPSPQMGRHTARKTVRFAAAGSPQSQGSFNCEAYSTAAPGHYDHTRTLN